MCFFCHHSRVRNWGYIIQSASRNRMTNCVTPCGYYPMICIYRARTQKSRKYYWRILITMKKRKNQVENEILQCNKVDIKTVNRDNHPVNDPRECRGPASYHSLALIIKKKSQPKQTQGPVDAPGPGEKPYPRKLLSYLENLWILPQSCV